MLIAIVLFYTLICIIELVPLIKKKRSKDIWCYSAIISIAFTLSVLMALGVNIPDPSKSIKKFVFAVMGK